jgi:catechol 2,3-dioxygenase-like lactoylglutathione lyase family enzyme
VFGRFLELSVTTPDIAASVQFYERLGFAQLATGDALPHPYGVLSDGRLCLGLHQRTGPARQLSFVHPGLARHVHELLDAGFEPHAARLGDDDFHELQLRDPAGQDIALLEARTFSPPRSDHGRSHCGWFSGYSLPAFDIEQVRDYWERAGFVALDNADDPIAQVALTSDTLTLSLHQPRAIAAPLLVFTDPEMPERLARLAAAGVHAAGVHAAPGLPAGLDPRANALLEAPEGTLLLLTTEG